MAEPVLAHRDRDFWAVRMRALASLAGADALAVVLPGADGAYVCFAAHNIGQDRSWLDGSASYLLWSVFKEHVMRTRAESRVPLSDGRVARSILVAPITWSGQMVGALVGLRCAPVYETGAGAQIGELGELVGLELAVSNLLQNPEGGPQDDELRRARSDRQHALALYELTRRALGAPAGGLDGAARLLADVLGFAVVGIWVDEGDGWLRLQDGHGYPERTDRARIETDGTLLRVVRDGTTQRVQRVPREGDWAGSATDVIAAPLGPVGSGARGMLVLGSPDHPLTAADVTIAPTLAEALAAALTASRIALSAPAAAVRPAQLAPPAVPAEARPVVSETAPEHGDAPVSAAPVEVAIAPAALPTRAADTATKDRGPEATEPEATEPESTGPEAATARSRIAAPVTIEEREEPQTSRAGSRSGWAVPLLAFALLIGAAAVFVGEPLMFVAAGVLLLLAVWFWIG